MVDILIGLLIVVGEGVLWRSLTGRSFKRGILVWEKNILEKFIEGGVKLVFGSRGYKERNSGE